MNSGEADKSNKSITITHLLVIQAKSTMQRSFNSNSPTATAYCPPHARSNRTPSAPVSATTTAYCPPHARSTRTPSAPVSATTYCSPHTRSNKPVRHTNCSEKPVRHTNSSCAPVQKRITKCNKGNDCKHFQAGNCKFDHSDQTIKQQIASISLETHNPSTIKLDQSIESKFYSKYSFEKNTIPVDSIESPVESTINSTKREKFVPSVKKTQKPSVKFSTPDISCKKGLKCAGNCEFVHPNEYTDKTECCFGEKCRDQFTTCTLVHPSKTKSFNVICLHDKKCFTKNCPYIHPSKPCRYGDKCKYQTTCTYYHQTNPSINDQTEPCRFGAHCMNRAYCRFDHSL